MRHRVYSPHLISTAPVLLLFVLSGACPAQTSWRDAPRHYSPPPSWAGDGGIRWRPLPVGGDWCLTPYLWGGGLDLPRVEVPFAPETDDYQARCRNAWTRLREEGASHPRQREGRTRDRDADQPRDLTPVLRDAWRYWPEEVGRP